MFFNFSGAYAEWNYEDIKSLNYCPYTPFLFSFIVLILSCILIGLFLIRIICFLCAGLNEYGQNRRENIDTEHISKARDILLRFVSMERRRTNNRMDYEYLE